MHRSLSDIRIFAPAVFLLALTGCHHRSRELRFTLEPTNDRQVKVSCVSSTSDKCHFVFYTATGQTNLSLAEGADTTVKDVDPTAQYCAGNHILDPSSCKQKALPGQRATITIQESSNSPTD